MLMKKLHYEPYLSTCAKNYFADAFFFFFGLLFP